MTDAFNFWCKYIDARPGGIRNVAYYTRMLFMSEFRKMPISDKIEAILLTVGYVRT